MEPFISELNQNQIRVFLVEEDPLACIAWQTRLNVEPDIHVVGEKAFGTVALPIIQEIKPDVALFSMKLGNINCLEMAEKLQQETENTTKLVLVTPEESELELLGSLSVKARGYCSKYVDLDLMPTIIKVVHQGGIWLDTRMLSVVLGLFSSELPHNSEQQHIILTPEEISLIQKTNRQQWVGTLLSNTSELLDQQEAVHRLISKLVQDDRVQQAAKALKALYGPKHRQALLEQPCKGKNFMPNALPG